jgi:hypothetical protein
VNDDATYALIGDKVVNEMAWVLMDVLDALDHMHETYVPDEVKRLWAEQWAAR